MGVEYPGGFSDSIPASLAAYGFTYKANDPLAVVYPLIIASHQQGIAVGPSNSARVAVMMECCMRSGYYLFAPQGDKPGACGTKPGQSTPLATIASKLALSGAQIGEGIAGVGLSSALGAATAGIGLVLGPIIGIFTAHSQKVQQEKSLECQVAQGYNQTISSIDQAVYTGQATPQQGFAAVQQLAAQAKASLQQMYQDCNEQCIYGNILGCLTDIRAYAYGLTAIPNGVPEEYEDSAQGWTALVSTSSTGVVTSSPVASPALALTGTGTGTIILVLVVAVSVWLIARG